jgi:carbon-monoxide dehydrogenase medium subunit
MTALPDFAHHRPTRLEDALELVSMFDRPPYVGGTELLLAMRAGLFRPEALVDLKRIPELRQISAFDGGVSIGGAVTHQMVVDSPVVGETVPMLPGVIAAVGNPRVRASGTLGGNLCFAEPKSDVATMLVALEATVRLASSSGGREMPVADFVVGPYSTSREEGELLTEIVVPGRAGRPAVYVKYQTMERPTIGVAAAITQSGACRVVVGAVGGMPEVFEADRIDELDPHRIASQLEVIPDLTGSARYKRHIAAVHVRRALDELEEST